MLDDKAAWSRTKSSVGLAPEIVGRLVSTAFPQGRVVDVQVLQGGLSNSIFKVRLDSFDEPFVLRVYDRDPSACRKEVDLLRLVRRTVPVPEVIHAEPDGIGGVGPFVLMRYVEGITFRKLKEAGDARAIGEAARSVGETLAAIGLYSFPNPGRLRDGPEVCGKFIEGPDTVPRFVDACLDSPCLKSRMGDELRGRLREFVWGWASRLAGLDEERSLVHGDFNSPNILVRTVEGKWAVAAVLDWEFALSGSTLFDIGNFLRYERAARPLREPHFSEGYAQGGGTLPEDWRRLARVIDLTSLCEFLTREELPDDIVSEVLDLIRATIEDRDPMR
ncbi:MAG: phosphotransferase [Rubrivivax sp.]|nr:phosphotransferase [Pyrinomonadaceae bacterium]